ncbi:MAG TPA: hypothetical protein VKB51_12095 [bacterium]|nr:hypothetical protein [bacterium]
MLCRGSALLACGLALWVMAPGQARAVELCSREGRTLMRSVHIRESQIRALCEKEARAAAPLTLRVSRTVDELGHCRVTLALVNNSTLYLNALVLTVEEARYVPFAFRNITPGGTGYASSNSRILMACSELRELRLVFHWPPSLRIGDRSPDGQQLLYYRPYLLDSRLAWSQSGSEGSP